MSQVACKSEIQSAAIFRCTVKKHFVLRGRNFKVGDAFYLVPSDSEPGVTHLVHYDAFLMKHFCSCPAKVWDCKHVRAAIEVAKARKQQVTRKYDVVAEAGKVASQAVADAQIGDAYEVRAEQMAVIGKQYDSCDYCGRNHKSWNCPL